HVGRDHTRPAAIVPLPQFAPEPAPVMTALVPTLPQVLLIGIQLTAPPRAPLVFRELAALQPLAHRVPLEPDLPRDRRLVPPARIQTLALLIACQPPGAPRGAHFPSPAGLAGGWFRWPRAGQRQRRSRAHCVNDASSARA